MTTSEKRTKILAAAATHGHHADIYLSEAHDLRKDGLIELRHVFTKTGARVGRWFLTERA